jgi:phosphatidylinositol alpha-mannosyltransferase
MMSVSRCAARFARETYGIDSRVVPNMIDTACLRALAGPRRSASRTTRIVYLGALVERKGPDRLLEAFIRLRGDHPSLTLTIAGEGPLRRHLERRVAGAGCGSAVRILGEVGEREKAELLGGAEVACFPSHHGESFGIVLLEAIAAGSEAVLAGDNPGYAELFSTCPEAVCDAAPASLHRRLEWLLDPCERWALRNKQQHILRSHRLEDVTGRVLGIYEEALEAREGRVRTDASSLFAPAVVPADAPA